MHFDIAVVAERFGDRQAGGERIAEAVNENIYLLAVAFGKLAVKGYAEVVPSVVAFDCYVVCGL